jgi:hypothetical protein
MKILKLLSVVAFTCFVNANILYGQIATKIGSFNRIEVFGKINVRLQKSNNDSLFINSGSFDVEKVTYIIENGVLKIKLLSEFPPEIKVDITVDFQQINSLKAGGGTKIYNRGVIDSKKFVIDAKSGCELDLAVDIDSVKVKVNKGAFVRLTGKNRFMQLKTATGGDFRSTNMESKIVVAVLNGGTAEIKCSEHLDATVRYGASLKFVEPPKQIKRKERLGGTIGKLEDF